MTGLNALNARRGVAFFAKLPLKTVVGSSITTLPNGVTRLVVSFVIATIAQPPLLKLCNGAQYPAIWCSILQQRQNAYGTS